MDAETEYRRGTILGLTIAEVFILLLFLLLLMYLGLHRHWEVRSEAAAAKLTQAEERLTVTEDTLERWHPVMDEFKAPDRVMTLQRRLVEAQAEAKRHREAAAILEKLEDGETDQASQCIRALRDANAGLEEAESRARRCERNLAVIKTKGHNPPCWYRMVDDEKGGQREKAYYMLDVGVFDDHFVLRAVEPPPGRAVDDDGRLYVEEAAQIGLDAVPYGTRLSDSQFQRHLAPISEAGQDGLVRTYSCIFWVRVWDNTSEGAKRRWQRAHDRLIEGLFGAYTVQEDAW